MHARTLRLSRRTTFVVIALGLLATNAPAAEPCTPSAAGTPGSTLAAPVPCAHPSKRPLAVPQDRTQPRGQQPGTFQYGNTTIRTGGSISTEVGIGGHR